MSEQNLKSIQERLRTAAWTPGKRDIEGIFACWRGLTDAERENLSARIARLDAPSVLKAIENFSGLDARSRGDLARPILKSYFQTIHALTIVDPLGFPTLLHHDVEARVRKALAQGVGSSWGVLIKNKSHTLRDDLVRMLIAQLRSARDQSELKAIVESLGKSGDERAIAAIQSVETNAPTGASTQVKKSLMTLRRDVARIESIDDRCHPEKLPVGEIVVWFTHGVEHLAKGRDPFYGATELEEGVLKIKNGRWSELTENYLWRAAGAVLGRLSPRYNHNHARPVNSRAVDDIQELARVLRDNASNICAATTVDSGAPIRIRLGRCEGFTRADIWSFAEMVSDFNCGLINDGRDAHWELAIVSDNVVLIPLKFSDTRFVWRDVNLDGASDPTIAAALAQLACIQDGEKVWDPFCGAATELIIAGKKSKFPQLLGTDVSQEAIEAAQNALRASSTIAVVAQENCLDSDLIRQHGPVDVVITNPPFGIRTVRAGARELLEDFLGGVAAHMREGGRLVLLSHAPRSTILWSEAGNLKLKRSFPVYLGQMRCELQVFEPKMATS